MSDSLVVGSPGVLAAWAHALIREAAALAASPTEIRALDRKDEPGGMGTDEADHDRIYLCNFPSPSVIAKVAEGAVPTLALLDEPADAVRFVMKQTNQNFTDVLRISTLAHTVNRALFDNPHVLILHRSMEDDPDALIDLVLEFLSLKIAPETLAGIKERQTAAGATRSLEDLLARNVSEWTPLDELPKHLSADELAIVDQSLSPLIHYAFDQTPPRVIWQQKLFLFSDKPDTPLPIVAELTGRARTILYGPYLYLPPGCYRLFFMVGFSDELRGMPFVIKVTQLFGQSTIAEARCKAPGGGIYEGSFTMKHARSNESIEITMRNEEGAIEGRVALVQIAIELMRDDELDDESPQEGATQFDD